ncbi:MAG: DsbA family protein [Thermoplasmata archaeon]
MKPKRASERQSVPGPQLTIPVDERRDHVQGRPDAAVTLVEYGDYQCPYCGAAYPIVKQLQQTVGDPLRFVFRNFPLTQLHPRAEFAAELAESAGSHGKFWEMHDFIFENQRSLDDSTPFLRFAQERLRLDSEVLGTEVAQHVHRKRVEEDFMSGVRSGVNGTPTFFINGTRHDDDFELDTLSRAIRAAFGGRRSP